MTTQGQGWHIAQFNTARARTALDSQEMAEFFGALERINSAAESAPGFVWRGPSPEDPSPPTDDPRLLENMSAWSTAEALFDYVYRSTHTEAMAQFRQRFERPTQAHQALWWIPAGHIPTLAEARERLEQLRAQGPTQSAFSFKQRFPPPGESGEAEDMKPEPWCSGWR